MFNIPSEIDVSAIVEFISTPSFKSLQLAVIIYFGLLWLSIIIWVTRDAINRSDSLIFQVFAILLNILFPVLGILLYLIIRPSKTTLERYYEDLEHKLILESINEKSDDSTEVKIHPIHKAKKKHSKKEAKKNKE